MSRIGRKFRALARSRRKALIVFLTAGDPSLKKTEELIYALENDGVDLIELGVPFSDPLADGPVIQAASSRSLEKGTTLAAILKLVARVRRKSDIPLVFMSYLNPVLGYGLERFGRDARKSGLDGLIVPDLPPEEGKEAGRIMRKNGIDLIYLLAPTSTADRQRRIGRATRGFVYYVSLTGVTGMRRSLAARIHERIRGARRFCRVPICAGFGISTPAQARAAARSADGVIVGSALVQALSRSGRLSAAAFSKRYVRPFARALGKF
ncbi:MAG: tryptophan synthase subunit alpha [Omnitrophica bacterium RIFCSPHIGHO2_02_FULL_63_14]|nr:MAG: tryptophan synthase subunit alpha [Omnitrophica bacterium RIFCSPHIGHO2_02_FULL_63_14]